MVVRRVASNVDRSHSLTIWRTHTYHKSLLTDICKAPFEYLPNVDRLRRYPMYRHLKKSSLNQRTTA